LELQGKDMIAWLANPGPSVKVIVDLVEDKGYDGIVSSCM
jgi:hypothetical protein